MSTTYHKTEMFSASLSYRPVVLNGIMFQTIRDAAGEAELTPQYHSFTIAETPGEALLSLESEGQYRRRWKRTVEFTTKHDRLWMLPQRRFDVVGFGMPDDTFQRAGAGTVDVSEIDFRHISTGDDDMLLKTCIYLAFLVRQPEPEQHLLLVDMLLARIAAEVMHRCASYRQQRELNAPGGLDGKRLQLVLDYINDHLDRHIRLSELAGVAGASECHFSRSFTRATGTSPMRYILERRIERAKQLLRNRDSSLVDVALASGFCSQSHFTTVFKQMTGFTPAKFRAAVIGIIKSATAALIVKTAGAKYLVMLGLVTLP